MDLAKLFKRESLACPHCTVTVNVRWQDTHFASEGMARWIMRHATCPACARMFARLVREPVVAVAGGDAEIGPPDVNVLIWPKVVARKPVPAGVPKHIADDYGEACAVLSDSPKASAALSRRCLQNVLVNVAGAKSTDLYDQIDEIVNMKTLPGRIAENLSAVRLIGNFAAHPTKSKATGQIVDVEPGEAEWNLEVLEDLFDFYFVEPDRQKKRKDALNAKLIAAGKPPIP